MPFAIVWILSDQMIRRVFGRDARAGIVAGGSAAYSNALLIGLPLMQTALGESGTVFLIVIIAVHLPVMMTISVSPQRMGARRGRKGDRRRVAPRSLPPARCFARRGIRS